MSTIKHSKCPASDLKITRYAKKQGNMTHNYKKNQSIEIGPEITEVMGSVDKVFNSFINTFKDLKDEQNEKRN